MKIFDKIPKVTPEGSRLQVGVGAGDHMTVLANHMTLLTADDRMLSNAAPR